MKTAKVMGKDGMSNDPYFLLRNSEDSDFDGKYVYTDYDDKSNIIQFSTTNQYGNEYNGDDIMCCSGKDPILALQMLGYQIVGTVEKPIECVDENWEQAVKRKQNEIWKHICG